MAIFNAEQVASLNAFQQESGMHPFTCGSGRRTDGDHTDGSWRQSAAAMAIALTTNLTTTQKPEQMP